MKKPLTQPDHVRKIGASFLKDKTPDLRQPRVLKEGTRASLTGTLMLETIITGFSDNQTPLNYSLRPTGHQRQGVIVRRASKQHKALAVNTEFGCNRLANSIEIKAIMYGPGYRPHRYADKQFQWSSNEYTVGRGL